LLSSENFAHSIRPLSKKALRVLKWWCANGGTVVCRSLTPGDDRLTSGLHNTTHYRLRYTGKMDEPLFIISV
jgi:hypothetical protein